MLRLDVSWRKAQVDVIHTSSGMQAQTHSAWPLRIRHALARTHNAYRTCPLNSN